MDYILAIKLPKYVKVNNYRTMTSEKKKLAVQGSKIHQLEWMKEEINEFYEAISLCDIIETFDEAIGLIRTAQQFKDSKRVMAQWVKVAPIVRKVLSNRKQFYAAFRKWKQHKSAKGQAKGVTARDLIDFAALNFK